MIISYSDNSVSPRGCRCNRCICTLSGGQKNCSRHEEVFHPKLVTTYRYRALYNYKPHNDDEVELAEGDLLYVMEMCDDGWFVGTSQRTGIFGTFPGNYVERAA